MIRIGTAEAFHDVQLLAAEIAGAAEPSQAVQAGDVHYQGVAFPMPVVGSHPGIRASLLRLAHIDQAIRTGELIYKHDAARRLHDLERIWHIVGARNARHVTLGLWIVGAAV